MGTRKLKLFTSSLLVAVGCLALAAGGSVARGRAEPILRLHDRTISVDARMLSFRAVKGLLDMQLVVTVHNIGRRPFAVSGSDFRASAQGDVFGLRAWDGGRHRLTVRAGRKRVVRLTFALPGDAARQAALSYTPGPSGTTSSLPLSPPPAGVFRASAPAAASPSINTFYVNGVGEPWGTAIDRAGNEWFAEPGCDFAPTCSASAGAGQIGELKAGWHSVVLYKLPTVTGNQPIFLAFDGSGNLWFTTPNNSMIGEFDPSTGQFIGQWPVTAGSGPWDLIFSRGKIWYTEHLASAVGVFDPVTHVHQDFQTPSANSNPYGIAANGGLIWFTENNSSVDRIAVLDTTSNSTIREYPIVQPTSGTPHLVVIGAGGGPWWTEGWSTTIATLNPAVATPGQCGTSSGICIGIQRFTPPGPTACTNQGSHTSGVGYDAGSGLVWFDNSLTAQVGSFNPSGNAFSMTQLPSCGSHAHDGLGVDGLGNVWWDEEFANALGELIPQMSSGSSPSVITGSASAVGASSATLGGSVDPNGQATTYHFDYAVSTGYGSQAPAAPDPSAGSGMTSEPISANLTGLTPGTTYHYRLEATNATGTQYGADQTFVTASASTYPTLTRFSPGSGGPGTAVTITGTNLAGATAVAFNGTAAAYTVNSASQITATVPTTATAGPISVTTPSGTATGATSFTVVSVGSVLAQDTFNRIVTGGWGAADVGGLWTILDTPTSWSVAAGAGTVTVAKTQAARAALTGVDVADVDLLAKLVVPLCAGGTNCDSYVIGRCTGGSSPTYYRVGAVQGQGQSTVFLRAQRSDGSYLTADLNTGIPSAPGVALWIRVEFQGFKPTAIRARIWADGTPEPSTWLLNTNDSASAEQVAGAVGVRTRNEDTATARTFQFQSFQATALP